MKMPGRSSASLVDTDYKNGAKWYEGVNEFQTVKSHAAIAAGDVVVITHSSTGPLTVAAATSSVYQRIGVAVNAASGAGEWITVQLRGFAEASVEGTTDVAAGDFLEVLTTENDFKKDGAARTVYSGAVAVDAQPSATPTVVTVYLIGDPVQIAAS